MKATKAQIAKIRKLEKSYTDKAMKALLAGDTKTMKEMLAAGLPVLMAPLLRLI